MSNKMSDPWFVQGREPQVMTNEMCTDEMCACNLRGVFEQRAVWRDEQAQYTARNADDVALLKSAAQRLLQLADTVDDMEPWEMQQYLATIRSNNPRATAALAELAARVGINYMPDNASAFVFQFVMSVPLRGM